MANAVLRTGCDQPRCSQSCDVVLLWARSMSVRIPASYVSKAHTLFASAAFLSALLVGGRLHYRKIVKNDVAGYPEEWWPSVSATFVILFLSVLILTCPGVGLVIGILSVGMRWTHQMSQLACLKDMCSIFQLIIALTSGA